MSQERAFGRGEISARRKVVFFFKWNSMFTQMKVLRREEGCSEQSETNRAKERAADVACLGLTKWNQNRDDTEMKSFVVILDVFWNSSGPIHHSQSIRVSRMEFVTMPQGLTRSPALGSTERNRFIIWSERNECCLISKTLIQIMSASIRHAQNYRCVFFLF